MRSTFANFAALGGLFMLGAQNPEYFRNDEETPEEIARRKQSVCKNCVNFPTQGKTFCKMVKHNIKPFTSGLNCRHFNKIDKNKQHD